MSPNLMKNHTAAFIIKESARGYDGKATMNKIKNILFNFLLAAFFITGSAVAATTQWPTADFGGKNVTNEVFSSPCLGGEGWCNSVAFVPAPAGDAYMVWTRDSQTYHGQKYDILAQRLSNADGGNVWGSPVTVVSNITEGEKTGGRDYFGTDGSGGFVTVYADEVSSNCYISDFNSSGAKLWGPTQLNSDPAAHCGEKISLAGGNAFIAFSTSTNGQEEMSFVQAVSMSSGAKKFSGNGITAPFGWAEPASSPAGGGQSNAGAIFVTGQTELSAFRVDSNGNVNWSVTYSTITANIQRLFVLPDGASGAYIVWADAVTQDINAIRINANGVLYPNWPLTISVNMYINSNHGNNDDTGAFYAVSTSSGVIVSWAEDVSANAVIHAALLDPNGTGVLWDHAVDTLTPGTGSYPSLTMDGNNLTISTNSAGAVAIAYQYGNSSVQKALNAVVLTNGGQTLAPAQTVMSGLTTDTSNHNAFAVPAGGDFVVGVMISSSIYAQKIMVPASPVINHAKGPNEFVIRETDVEDLGLFGAYGGGKFLVGYRYAGANIGARLIAPDGTQSGPEITFNTSTEYGAGDDIPIVAFDGVNFLLVWSCNLPGYEGYMRGQLIDTSGNKVGSSFWINSDSAYAVHRLDGIAFDGVNYLVVWADENANANGQFVSKAGNKVGGAFKIGEAEKSIAIAFARGKYFAAMKWGNDSSSGTIKGRFIETNGTMGPLFDIAAIVADTDDSGVSVAADTDRFLVAYHEPYPPYTQSDGYGTHHPVGRFVSDDGTVSSAFQIPAAVGPQKYPLLVWDGSKYLITWNENTDSTSTVHMRYFDASGTPLSADTEIASLVSGKDALGGAVAYDSIDKKFLVLVNRSLIGDNGTMQDVNYAANDLYGLFITTTASQQGASFTGDFSQPGGAVYDGGSTDQLNRLVYDPNGHFIYAVGYSSMGVNNTDWAIIKYDMNGIKLASATLNIGTSDDNAWDAAIDNSGNLYAIGQTGTGSLLVKYNSNLTVLASVSVPGMATGVSFGKSNSLDYLWALTFNGSAWGLIRYDTALNVSAGFTTVRTATSAWGSRPRTAVVDGNPATLYVETGSGEGPSFDQAAYNFTTYKCNGDTLATLNSTAFTAGAGNKSVDIAVNGSNVYVVGMSTSAGTMYGVVVKYNASSLTLVSSATFDSGADPELGRYGAIAIDTNTADVYATYGNNTHRFDSSLNHLAQDSFGGNGLVALSSGAVYIGGGENQNFVTKKRAINVTPVVHAKGANEFVISETDGRDAGSSTAYGNGKFLTVYQKNDSYVGARFFDMGGNPVGQEIVPADNTDCKAGQGPAVAFDGTNYLMTWGCDLSQNSDAIRGQRVDPSGNNLGASFTISSFNAGWGDGDVAFDGTNYFAVWSSTESGAWKIYGQRVSMAGELVGSRVTIATPVTSSIDHNPVRYGGGKYLVTWIEGNNVKGRMVLPDGSLYGSEIAVNVDSLNSDISPTVIAYDPVSTRFLVTYGNGIDSTNTHVYGRFVDLSGVAGSSFTISDAAGTQAVAAPAWDGSKYLMTWTDWKSYSAVTVHKRNFSGAGVPLDADTIIASNESGKVPLGFVSAIGGGKALALINRSNVGSSNDSSMDLYGLIIATSTLQQGAGFTGNFSLPGGASFDGGNMDYGTRTALYNSNLYVVGLSSPTGGLIIEYDLAGSILSSATFSGVGGFTVVKANANGVYATAHGANTGFVTAKYTQNLVFVSSAVLLGDSSVRALALDTNGNVYVIGSNWGPEDPEGHKDYKFVKYNSNLSQIGSPVTFNAGGADEGNDIAVDNGNIYVTGTSLISGITYYVTAKYNSSSMAFLSSAAYAGGYVNPDNSSSGKLTVNATTHEVYFAGTYGTPSDDVDSNILTIKYSPDLAQLATALFPYWYAEGQDVTLDNAGNVYTLGINQAGDKNNSGADYAVVLKYSPDLVFVSSAARQFTNGYVPVGIAMDKTTGESYVTGMDFGDLHDHDQSLNNMRTIKFPAFPVVTPAGGTFTGNFSLPGGAVYDGGAEDRSQGIVVDTFSIGGPFIYVVGDTSNTVTGKSEGLLVKYNSAGARLISAAIVPAGYVSEIHLQAVAVDHTGNVVVSGYGGDGHGTSAFAIKYDPSLNVVASTRTSDNEYRAIAFDGSSNIIIAGGAGMNNNGWAIRKYNPAMTVLMNSVVYHGPYNVDDEFAQGAAVNNAGEILVSGLVSNGITKDWKIRKYNSSLGFISEATFAANLSASDWATPPVLALDPAGNIIVAGDYDNNGNGRVVKYNSAFVQLSSASVKSGSASVPQFTSGGEVVIADSDGWTKFSSSLALLSYLPVTYPGPIALDSLGNVYTTGESHEVASESSDFHTTKSALSSGLTITHAKGPNEFVISETDVEDSGGFSAYGGGKFLVGYQHDGSNITARLVTPDGTLAGSEITFNTGTEYGSGAWPHAAFDGTNFLLVWDCDLEGYKGWKRGQFISTSGSKVGSSFWITTTGVSGGDLDGVAFDGTNYFVVWSASDTVNSYQYMYGQFVDKSGNLVDSKLTIGVGGKDGSVAFANGKYLVAWRLDGNYGHFANTETGYAGTVSGRFVLPNRSFGGPEFVIDSSPNASDNPVNVAADNTRFLVAFHDSATRVNTASWAAYQGDGSDVFHLYGKFVGADGTVAPSTFTIVNSPGSQFYAVPVWDGSKYLISWNDAMALSTAAVHMRYFDASGNPLGADTVIASEVSGRIPVSLGFAYDSADNKFFGSIIRDNVNGDFDHGNTDLYGLIITTTASQQVASFTGNFSQTGGAVYDGGAEDQPHRVAVDTAALNGPFTYVAGVSSFGKQDGFTVKYDKFGVMVASAVFSGSDNDSELNGIAIGADSIFVTGNYDNSSSGKCVTLKYNKNLVLQSSVTYSEVGWCVANDITINKSGNVYVTGHSNPSDSSRKLVVMSYDNNLNPLNSTSFSVTYDKGMEIRADDSGNVYVVGYSSAGAHYQILTLKYTPALAFVSSAAFAGNDNTDENRVSLSLGQNAVYVAGQVGTSNKGLLLKYDGNLVLKSSAAYNSVADSAWYGVSVSSAGDVFAAGDVYNGSNHDFLTAKYNANLVFASSRTYDSGHEDMALDAALDNSGNIYVVGFSSNGVNDDWRTIRYAASDFSASLPIYVPLAAPTAFAGNVLGASSVTWSWNDNADNETGYKVRNSVGGLITSLSANTTSWTELNLVPNTLYSRYVEAYNTPNVSSSTIAAARTLAAQPTGLTFTSVSSTSVNAQWNANGDPAGTTYQVDYSTDAGYNPVATVSVTTTNYKAVGLTGDLTYYFRVRAQNGDSVYTAYTQSSAKTTAQPTKPGAFTGAEQGISSITWTWNAADFVKQYKLYTSTVGFIASVSSSALSYAETGLLVNTQYTRYVQAWSADYQTNSDPASAYTAAKAPGAMSLTALSSTSVSAQWGANGNPAVTAYQVDYSTDAGYNPVATVSVTTTNYTATGLNPSLTYYFRVRARNGDNINTAYTPSSTVQTPAQPSKPGGFSGAVQGVSSITWTWSAADFVKQYKLYTSIGEFIASVSSNTLSYTETGLSFNKQYPRYIRAVWNENYYTDSDSTATYTAAAAPGDLSLNALNSTSVKAQWGANGNPAGTAYQVDYSTDAGYSPVSTAAVTATNYTATGLNQGFTYYFRVRARNGDNITTTYTPSSTVQTPAQPSKPGGFSGAEQGVSSITWTWSAADFTKQYNLYTGAGVFIASVSSNTLSYTETGLSFNKQYPRYIRAVWNENYYTNSDSTATYTAAAAPGAPSLTVLVPLSRTRLNAAWGANGNPAGTLYRVDYSTDAGFAGFLSLTTFATSLNLSGLTPGMTYYARVRAFNGDSVPTSIVNSSPETTPALPVISGIGPDTASNIRTVIIVTGTVSGFIPGDVAMLANRPANTTSASGGYFTAVFSLLGIEPGVWNIVLRDGEGNESSTSTLTQFTVSTGTTGGGITVSSVTATESVNTSGNLTVTISSGTTELAGGFIYLSTDPITTPLSIASGTVSGARVAPGTTLIPHTSIEVVAYNNNQPVTAFSSATVRIEIHYPDVNPDDGIVDGTSIQEENLYIVWLSTITGNWERIDSFHDTVNNIVWANVHHFSVYGIAGLSFMPDLSTVKIYPNPWKPGSGGSHDMAAIKFDNLAAATGIKIYNLVGELIKELPKTSAGSADWDGKTASGGKVSSGVYFAYIKSGSSHKIMKFAIER